MTRALFLAVALLLAPWAQAETRPPIQQINKIHSEGTKQLLAVCSPDWAKCRPTEAAWLCLLDVLKAMEQPGDRKHWEQTIRRCQP